MSDPRAPTRAAPQRAPQDFEDDVRRVLEELGGGTVMTYGEVALEAGHAGAARAVGTLLSRGQPGLPWWRVVTSTGRLVPGHEAQQARLLRAEGVRVADGRVVMSARAGSSPTRSRLQAAGHEGGGGQGHRPDGQDPGRRPAQGRL